MLSQCKALMIPTAASSPMDMQVFNVTQNLVLCTQSEKTGEQYANQLATAAIQATLKDICIEGALSILEAFNYDRDDFYFGGNKWQIHDLGNESYFPELQGRMADETYVFHFWGGPPNRLKWYTGTLQTFLEDRVLCKIEEKGTMHVARMIGTDIEGLTDVRA